MLKIFVFIDIWFVKQDFQIFHKNKDMQFLWKIWKKNKKQKKFKKKFDLPERKNPRFSVIFPPMIWIFIGSKEPDIKSKQASKRDRTLSEAKIFLVSNFYWHHLHAFLTSCLQQGLLGSGTTEELTCQKGIKTMSDNFTYT